jgi:hypothetical protein
MVAIVAFILFVIVAIAIAGFALHLLFSPWLLLVALGVVLWLKFRPSRSHR